MYNITIKKLSFISFIKLCSLISASLGLIIGIIALLGSFLDLPIETTLGFMSLQGIFAGLVSLILAPLLFLLFGIFIGIISYIPFHILLSIISGLNLTGRFKR